MRVGLNIKQWAETRRLLGMGWSTDQIARHFMAVPESLEKGIKQIRDKGQIIQPKKGLGFDREGLKQELRKELMDELREAGILTGVPADEVDAVVAAASPNGRGNENVLISDIDPPEEPEVVNMSNDGHDYSDMRDA